MAQKRAFPRICIALGVSEVPRLLECAQREAEAGESFLEFRLDYLPDPLQGCLALAKFLEQFPECQVLATCRRTPNHGRFAGSVEEQFRVLELAVESGAQSVDIEIETAEIAVERTASLRAHAFVVVSYHNFQSTPPLERVVKRLTGVPADAYKLVTTARKTSDALRVLEVGRTYPRTPMLLLAMGDAGLSTRVLSPAFGGLFTYAAPGSGTGTAPGQVGARQLRHLYRADKLKRAGKVFGVIADPVGHSISPAVHNRAFQSRRMDSVYLPFLVPPKQLKDFMIFAEGLPMAGFSVTIPHKQKIMRYLDTIDPMARRIGAVNTVWRKAGKWRGTNTDTAGVLVPLGRHLRLSGSSVLIAGNGGAARGAACALTDAGARVSITGRDPARVQSLANVCSAEAVTAEQIKSRNFDALVHATPIGMFPLTGDCYFDGEIPADVVFDMVYNPLETVLMRRARQQGKITIPGIEMFIEQAVKQFETWTGEEAPRGVMEKAALEALEQRA